MDRSSVTLVNFPRSATIYTKNLITEVYPNIYFQWTHNVYGFTLDNPITILRNPNESISSWLHYAYDEKNRFVKVNAVIKWYERFMSKALESKTTFFSFYDLTENPSNLFYWIGKPKIINLENLKNIEKNNSLITYDLIDEFKFSLEKSFELYNEAKLKIVKFDF